MGPRHRVRMRHMVLSESAKGREAVDALARRTAGAGANLDLLLRLPWRCAAMAVCCGLPLAWLLVQIIAAPASLGGLRMDAFRWALLARTLGYNCAVGVIATVLALPAALVLGRGRGAVAAAL